MNFSTPVLKADLVHQLIDEEDPTSPSCINVSPDCRDWNTGGIEALARVAHNDKDSPRLITSDTQLYLLAGVLFASMHNSVRQGLA